MFRRKNESESSEQVARLMQDVRRWRDLLARRCADVAEERAPVVAADERATSGLLYRVFEALGSATEV